MLGACGATRAEMGILAPLKLVLFSLFAFDSGVALAVPREYGRDEARDCVRPKLLLECWPCAEGGRGSGELSRARLGLREGPALP